MENQTDQIPVQEPIQNPISVPNPTKPNNRIIILFSIILFILLASTGFLYYQNINLQKQMISLKSTPATRPSASPDSDSKVVSDLVTNFYTALTKQDGKTLFDLMTKPATVAEETDFSWFTGVDLGTNAFYRAFLKTKITDPQISNIKIQSDGSYLVSIMDKFSGYSNAGSEVGYTNPQARTGITMTIVNTDGQWLVDKFTDSNYAGNPGNASGPKYNGLGQ